MQDTASINFNISTVSTSNTRRVGYFDLKFRANFPGHAKHVKINILFLTVYVHLKQDCDVGVSERTPVPLRCSALLRVEKMVVLDEESAVSASTRRLSPYRINNYSAEYLTEPSASAISIDGSH